MGNATLNARYRRIAAALEQRGTEVKLLDECPTCLGKGWLGVGAGGTSCDCPGTGTIVPSQADTRRADCETCQGRGWVPLPEAGRMGALVRVAGYVTVWWSPEDDCWRAEVHGGKDRDGSTPEAALTEALLAGEKVKE